MITCKHVAVLENEFIAGAQDKDSSLLPEIAVRASLSETIFHGPDALDQGCRAQCFQETALKPEGPVRTEVLVHIHLAGKMELFDEMHRTTGTAAPDGYQCYSGPLQFSLDTHEGSSLLPCKHSAEMAEEGKHDAPLLPQ